MQIEAWLVTERPVTPEVGPVIEEFSWLLENPVAMETNNASTENQLGVRKDSSAWISKPSRELGNFKSCIE